MGRPVILGNGSLTIGLNEQGLVHDFYYPYVGLENLTTARSMHHKVGVSIDGHFSWVDSQDWTLTVDFESDALVSTVIMHSDVLGVELHFHDFVDRGFNAFCRQVTVKNLDDNERTIRLFLHQVFEISHDGRGDTALFEPDDHYILDYKGRCSLLIYAQLSKGAVPFDQFSIGNYGIEGKEGTYKDAEDGELSNNPVEHGGVDSVVRCSLTLASGDEGVVDYWVAAADSQYSAEKIHHAILKDGLALRLEKTRQVWQDWLIVAQPKIAGMSMREQTLVKKSLMIIKAHTDKRGGIIASCDSSIYNYGRDYYSYVWPRDGALAMWPLIKLGYTEEPKRFFEFCRDILTDDGFLMHKYQPDRAIGSTWHPLLHGNHKELAIQEDETAVVIFMLGEYFKHSRDRDTLSGLYDTLVRPAADFMTDFRDEQTKLPHASYDLWEEKFLTNTYTVAVTYRALITAAGIAHELDFPDDAVKWRMVAAEIVSGAKLLFDPDRQAYRKGYLLLEDGSLQFDNTLDVSSMYAPLVFALHEFGVEEVRTTATAIENTLLDKSPSGGVPRYEYDAYFRSSPPYMGNPWIVTSLWLAQYYLRTNAEDKARLLLDWSLNHAVHSTILPEQVEATTGAPLSVTPLVWSHAELINTLLDIYHAS